MPMPQIQIFGGGAHAGRRVDIQDFMVVCPAAKTFAEALDPDSAYLTPAQVKQVESGAALCALELLLPDAPIP